MLSANELRIGNLVNYYDVDEQGELLNIIDWQDLKWLSENEKSFNAVHKPIPLTKEWLLKFGFEDKQNCFNLSKREKLGHDFGDFAVSKYDDTQMKVWRGDRYIGVCHIQYVHQLQNLYFALTNEELTLIK
jgi:hypothetical protein